MSLNLHILEENIPVVVDINSTDIETPRCRVEQELVNLKYAKLTILHQGVRQEGN